MTLTVIVEIIVLFLIVCIHGVFSYKFPRALGWVVPLLYVVLVYTFVSRGTMTSWVDWVMAVVGMVVLIGIWTGAKNKKRKAEIDRIDNTI